MPLPPHPPTLLLMTSPGGTSISPHPPSLPPSLARSLARSPCHAKTFHFFITKSNMFLLLLLLPSSSPPGAETPPPPSIHPPSSTKFPPMLRFLAVGLREGRVLFFALTLAPGEKENPISFHSYSPDRPDGKYCKLLPLRWRRWGWWRWWGGPLMGM